MQLTVEKLVSGGSGFTHTEDGRSIFLPGTLPREEVAVLSVKDRKNFLEAERTEVIKPSALRIKPECPYAGVCGGCDFDYVLPEDSAALKDEIVKDNIRRLSKPDEMPAFLPPVHGSGEVWRARVRIHVSMKERRAGFLGRSSNSLVEVRHCPRLEGQLDDILQRGDELVRSARSYLLSKGVNRKTGYIELSLFNADDRVLIEGDEGVRTIDGIPYHVRGDVFFQSNPSLVPALFDFVRSNTVGESIMDLYSGVGTFSALFENTGKHVIAVERQKECLALARKNAPSAESYTGDVALWGRKNSSRVDTVIVDPPRTGLDKGVPEMIASWLPERIVYVSCNSVTLARDIPHFTGYRPILGQIFDFYPGSSHEESAVVLQRI